MVQRPQQARVDQPRQDVDHGKDDVEVARGILEPRDGLVDVRKALHLDVQPLAGERVLEARDHVGRQIVLPFVDTQGGPAFDRQIAGHDQAGVDRERLPERRHGWGADGRRAAAIARSRGTRQREADGQQRSSPQERPPPDRLHVSLLR